MNSAKLPELISTSDKALMVADAIKQIQAEIFRLEVTQTLNGHKHTDQVPGSQVSYEEQRNLYNSGLERLQVCYPMYTEIIGGSARGI